MDVEKQALDGDGLGYFRNEVVRSFAWRGVSVEVQQRNTGVPKVLLERSSGRVRAGQLVALMGPSGSGKTTLLTALARRPAFTNSKVYGDIAMNGQSPSLSAFRRLTAFVEQEDTLIGSLTVRETLDFAARLSLPSSVSKRQRRKRVNALLKAFGLEQQAGVLVGTPLMKGISGGQKRRLSIATQIITAPNALFLDEPTSGLDSAASFEVVSYLRRMAKQTNMIIIASIHQPSTAVFNMFDTLILLTHGKTAYSGTVTGVQKHFTRLGFPLPVYANPAESVIDLVSTDFAADKKMASARLQRIEAGWQRTVHRAFSSEPSVFDPSGSELSVDSKSGPNQFFLPLTLIHRSFIKSYRDVLTYGIRLAMYLGLAIMMGTVWLRLQPNQDSIQSFVNAIFFGGAFLSFMAVAYIPAYLEDRAMFIKERANGFYGPTAFMVANFLIGVPYLFVIVVLFSLISYWLTGFSPTGPAFLTWILFLFLDLLAAESLVVLISSLLPIFVAALAATAFANGLWMSVGGFLVPTTILNGFWKYAFHYVDYQAYVFQGMLVNEFAGRTYACGEGCSCAYPSELAAACQIPGTAVLASYGFPVGGVGRNVGILVAIIFAYRVLGWLALYVRRT